MLTSSSRRIVSVVFAAALASAATLACAGILDIEDRFFPGDAQGNVGEAATGDALADSNPSGGDGGDSGVGEDGGPRIDGGCPIGMVPTASFCIDATEVTQKAYQAFLEATKNDASAGGQIPLCAANDTFKASDTCKPFTFDPGSTRPMACIDWCDAYAYCNWAGKRLCGHLDGGAVPVEGNILQSTSDQWFSACTRQADGLHAFPYGPEYDAGVCNDRDHDAGTSIEVGSAGGCVGGYAGVFDMSGNLWEWEDSCNNDAGTCVIRGGSFNWGSNFFPNVYLSCNSHYDGNARTTTLNDIGFRCCSP